MSLALTLAICLTWFALAVAFSALGVFALRRSVGLPPRLLNVYLSVWAGFSILTGGLLLWHFFLPVNGATLFVFATSAIICLFLERRWFVEALRTKRDKWLVFVNVIFAIWAANHSLGPAGMDDTNYEFQAIRWFHDYPIVPGLANLHGRIGFNNSHHLFASMLSVGPWSGQVNHLFNGLFVVFAFGLVSASMRAIASGRLTSSNLLAASLWSPCIGLVLFGIFGPMISTLKADVFVCAATITVAILFLEFAQGLPGNENYPPLGSTILLLCSVLTSVKLSAIIFAGLIALVVSWRLLQNRGWTKPANHFAPLASVVIISCVMIRGVILSGYPLYPSTLFGLPVDWRVPAAQANAERAFVTSWAQLRPTYDLAAVTGFGWVQGWLKSTILTDKFNIVLPVTLALICLCPVVFHSIRGRFHISVPGGVPTLVIASVASLFAWFQNAPAGRFGFAYFWILFGVALSTLSRIARPYLLTLICASIPIILVIGYILNATIGVPAEFRSGIIMLLIFSLVWTPGAAYAIAHSRTKLLVLALLALGFFQIGDRVMAGLFRRRINTLQTLVWREVDPMLYHQPEANYLTRQTRQGFTIYEVHGSTFNDPLPNTHYLNPWLEERVLGDLSKGFRNAHPPDPSRYGYSIISLSTESGMDDKVTPN